MKQMKTKPTMKQTRSLFFVLLLFLGNLLLYGQCGVNAGGNTTICGTSYTLQGTTNGTPSGTPVWTIVNKPPGAPDPVFSNPNIMTPNVTGMTFPGNYTFQVANTCSGTPVTSQVTITSPGATTGFTAGPDITTIPATTGVATLNATIPDGYTPSWRFYNLYNFETFTSMDQTNASLSGATTATPTLTLTNKANHTIDPAYRVIVRITSNVNSSCWYEDDAIVRFIPNPNMLWNAISAVCVDPGTTGDNFYYDPTAASPKLATTTANSSGTIAAGTTVTMAVISQPAGGNIQYSRISNGRLHFSGISAIGDYVFDLTISNSTGSSTNRLTYRFNGFRPSAMTFLDPAYPNQTELYSGGNTGGAVYCNMVGSTAPITFSYKINAADSPTISDAITISAQIPSGGAPTYVQSGAGTANRSITLTPPSGGWRAGTYKVAIVLTAAGGCTRQHIFYAHISDNARPAVNVDNITICYPGSGVVTATVPLPASYIAPASNPSYLQDYNGRYDFTLVSSPVGAATPTYELTPNRSLTSASTVISNLNKAGEYVFRIKAVGNGSNGLGKILTDEYACAGTSMEDTFSVFVTAQVGANAGSSQNITTTQTTLHGNDPGVATGMWTLVTKPAGANDPVITNPALYNSTVTGMTSSGTYTFRWTVTTGSSSCVSTSDTNINVTINNCVTGCNPNTFLNAVDPNTIEYDNIVSTFHSTIIKESDGGFKIWGEEADPNGTDNLLSPKAITPANGFNYTGTLLKATGAMGSTFDNYHQYALLTTDGLYVWGVPNYLISSSIKSTSAFGKITVGSKTDGLPPGVTPDQVKMLFASYGTLAITTCSGDAWMLSMTGAKNGDGTAEDATNNAIWHRVKTSATTNLNNVVALRGNHRAAFALTSTGELYTWGSGTYINSGAAQNRTYATQVTVPTGVIPKMIGMPAGRTSAAQTYYLLATDGRVFSMGNSDVKQLGNGSNATSTTWVQPQKPASQGQGTGALTNVAWISPNEHFDVSSSYFGAITVLTNDRKIWSWGMNDFYMIGVPGGSSAFGYEPTYMPGTSPAANGMKVTDEIIAVETGGHTTINIKKGDDRFGYVGHYVNGSMGNGIVTDSSVSTYSYQTAIVMGCGAEVGPSVQDLQVCNGTTANLNNANLATVPAEVEWHATNSASSPVMTNITAVPVGTYYAFYTVASGKQRVAGSAATVTGVVCCSTGDCNPNTFVNAVDSNTIEYDNMVSMFHSTIIKESNGTFKVWGEKSAPNGTGNLLSPTEITSANSFNYLGTPLKATGGSGTISGDNAHQLALLTTDGLYVWGTTNALISSSIKNTTAFGKIMVDGKADGLPAGVIPQQVKMMFGSFGTLAIVTCNGDAWVLSITGSKNGDGTTQNSGTPNSNTVWHRVKTDAAGNPNLNNVVAMRGNFNALFALTSNGEIYTWGTGTYLGDGTAVSNRAYATKVTVPTGVTPKMIGITRGSPTGGQAYYLLASDGRIFSMGLNTSRQLGDGTTTERTTWVQPQKPASQGQGTGALTNIAWISPGEHSTYGAGSIGAINVLTNDRKQWAWGINDYSMLGGSGSSIDPTYMPGSSTAVNGLKVTDEVIAVETGGHTSMNVKKDDNRFGYVGHYVNGSMGNGSTADSSVSTYSYQTAIVMVCGAPTSSLCYKPGVLAGTALDTKTGITALSRAGTDNGNWPMERKGAWTVLESKEKGFVINRVATTAGLSLITNPIEGMMVYDQEAACLKIYTIKDGESTANWHCLTTQACPD